MADLTQTQSPEGSSSAIDPDSAAKTHLLVVEDEPLIRRLFSMLLTSAGYSVAEAENGFAALEEIRRKRPALILSDLNMPRMTGFELLSVIRRRFPSIHVVAMSGAFQGDGIPNGVAADAFYEKSGRPIGTLVQVIEGVLQGSPLSPHPQPVSDDPQVALWVTRLGKAVEGPHLLLSCAECLRSFPHDLCSSSNEPPTMQVIQTPCVFCAAPISFAMLEPGAHLSQGQGPGPSV